MTETNKKKNVYFAQVAYKNGNTAYLPYAVGVLAAYAWQDERIKAHYNVAELLFLREDIDAVVARLDNPVYFGFSSCLWNIEYNKALAKKVKEKYPECIIQFGGHEVGPDNSLLKECDYIDILVHNEGEEAIRQLLLELLKGDDCSLESVNNITFRKEGTIITTENIVPDVENAPSPYLEGVFDKIMNENPDMEFLALIETNRGCPNHCSYCGWGMYRSKVRMFPMERIYREIEWVANHKMEFLGFADANFGLFERDNTIVDWMIDFKKKCGYPQKFQVSYAKNSTKKIFEMSKRLNENDMDKGITLAFQSLSQEVLNNVGRANIKMDYYSQLLKMYSEAGIATYSDLILGLPGETYDSFIDGINTLLKAGQHSSLFIHILQCLPCSEMAVPAYMEKYGIQCVKIPLNQPHRRRSESENDIPEFSKIIVETNTMSRADWVKMNLFAICVLSFHFLGVLEYIAIYLYYEKNVEYKDFYRKLLEFLLAHEELECGKIFHSIQNQLVDVIEKGGPVGCIDAEHYDDLYWTMEEFVFLELVRHKQEVFEELRPFVARFIEDEAFLSDIMTYQKEMIKTINQPFASFHIGYNFPEYFKKRIASNDCALIQQSGCVRIDDPHTYSKWSDYARFVVLYGRRGGKNLYNNEMNYTPL